MLHMNQKARYKDIWADIATVYSLRGTPAAHYVAGMCMGQQIAAGLSQSECHNLGAILRAARYAK